MKATSNNGFSLVELMIVIVVIAILAALVYGGAGYMNRKAIDARCEAQFAQLELAIEAYKNDHGFYPRTTGAVADSTVDPYGASQDQAKNACALRRALKERLNDFNKIYTDVGDAGVSANRPNPITGGSQSYTAGTALGNPSGHRYVYTCPGTYNKGGYDLSVSSELGKTYSNRGKRF